MARRTLDPIVSSRRTLCGNGHGSPRANLTTHPLGPGPGGRPGSGPGHGHGWGSAGWLPAGAAAAAAG
ncbi:protein of unknown function [Cyanobium sp. NIES-981]|nr:protein of unknown function [Cyanobium sp. NIES-981]